MLYRDFYPFYAAQGNSDFYNEEREQEREFDLMKSYYPDTARKIQEKAEAQCQMLDYEAAGFMMNIRIVSCCIIYAVR